MEHEKLFMKINGGSTLIEKVGDVPGIYITVHLDDNAIQNLYSWRILSENDECYTTCKVGVRLFEI